MPEQSGAFQAVLFDMDGVLVDSIPNHARAWQEAFAAQGVEMDLRLPKIREGEKALDTCIWICSELELDWSKDRCVEFVAEKRRIFRGYQRTGVFRLVPELLHDLTTQGMRIALVTGSTIVNARAIMPEQIWGLFEACITAEDVEQGKPNPEPYLKAAGLLGIHPGECLVVENAPLGIRSGKSAGCTVAALTTTLAREDLAGADVILEEHGQLLEWMKTRKQT